MEEDQKKARGECPYCGAVDILLQKDGNLVKHAHPILTDENCTHQGYPVVRSQSFDESKAAQSIFESEKKDYGFGDDRGGLGH